MPAARRRRSIAQQLLRQLLDQPSVARLARGKLNGGFIGGGRHVSGGYEEDGNTVISLKISTGSLCRGEICCRSTLLLLDETLPPRPLSLRLIVAFIYQSPWEFLLELSSMSEGDAFSVA